MTVRVAVTALIVYAVTAAGGTALWALGHLLTSDSSRARVIGALVPDQVPEGGAFTAWLQVVGDPASRAYGQLRICDAAERCVLAARQLLDLDGTPTLVRATRDLPPGRYVLHVLILSEWGPWGVLRTVERLAQEVDLG